MSTSLQVETDLTLRDLSRGTSSQFDSPTVSDPSATVHDYVDRTPINVATQGFPGSAFITLPTSVVTVERLIADLAVGTNLVVRLGGAVAALVGALGPFTFVGGETLIFATDNGVSHTATFANTDTTLALVAARINYAAGGVIVADTDPATLRLRLRGSVTGGAAAYAAGFQYGAVSILGGTALSILGLSAGVTYGKGTDLQVGGAECLQIPFPSGAQPQRIELSGTCPNALFFVAGRAT